MFLYTLLLSHNIKMSAVKPATGMLVHREGGKDALFKDLSVVSLTS